MKTTWWRSWLALTLGWLSILVLTWVVGLVFTLIDAGTLTARDFYGVPALGFYVGLFAFVGWLLFILPLTTNRRTRAMLFQPRPWQTAVAWLALALFAYGLLVTVWVGWGMMILGWIPALIGIAAGLFYHRLMGKVQNP